MAASYLDLPASVRLRAAQFADYRTLAQWAAADADLGRSRGVREELRRVGRVLADMEGQQRFSARFGAGCVAGDARHRANPFPDGEEGGLSLCRDPGACTVCPLVIEASGPEYRVCEEVLGGPACAVSRRPVASFSSLLDVLSFLRTSRFAARSCTDPRAWGLVRESVYEQAVAKPGGAFIYRCACYGFFIVPTPCRQAALPAPSSARGRCLRAPHSTARESLRRRSRRPRPPVLITFSRRFKPQNARGVIMGRSAGGPPVVPHSRWNEGWGGYWDVDCTTEWMEQSLESWLRFLLVPWKETPALQPKLAAQGAASLAVGAGGGG